MKNYHTNVNFMRNGGFLCTICLLSEKGKKGKRGSSGCFVTSSVCYAIGMPGDCEELRIIRDFRDTWLRKQKYGESDIEEYYFYAPRICSLINSTETAKEIYQNIYDSYILSCVNLIKDKNYNDCYELYKRMVTDLKKRFYDVGL